MRPPTSGSPRNAGVPSSRGSFCGRDGACQTPSYWSTRNRSFGIRHPAFTKGSALPVLTAIMLTKLPVAHCCFCCPVGRLSIDRFLVPQYEGKRQMPSRACFANRGSAAPTPFQRCQIADWNKIGQFATNKIANYTLWTRATGQFIIQKSKINPPPTPPACAVPASPRSARHTHLQCGCA